MPKYVIEVDFCASELSGFAHIITTNREEALKVWDSIMSSPLAQSIYLTSLHRLPKGEEKTPRLGIWRTGAYRKFANKDGEIAGEYVSHLTLDIMWACGTGLVFECGEWKVEKGSPNFDKPFSFSKED